MLELILAATATTLATGVGAIPVWLVGERAERLRPALTGVAGGVMAVAAVAGLLLPALDEGTNLEVIVGLALGVAFLFAARVWVSRPGSGYLEGTGRTAALATVESVRSYSCISGRTSWLSDTGRSPSSSAAISPMRFSCAPFT